MFFYESANDFTKLMTTADFRNIKQRGLLAFFACSIVCTHEMTA